MQTYAVILSHPLHTGSHGDDAVTVSALGTLEAEMNHRLRKLITKASISGADVIRLRCRTDLTPVQQDQLLKDLRELLIDFIGRGSAPLFVGSLSKTTQDELELVLVKGSTE